MADELGADSIAIPAIATGSFGFPKKQCAQIMFQCIINYGMDNYDTTQIREIKLVNIDDKTCDIFADTFDDNCLDNSHYS